MKSLIKTIVVTIGVLALLVAGGYYFITQNAAGESAITKVAKEIAKHDDSETSAEQQTVAQDGEWNDKDADMKEVTLQIYMHQMTHQKIIATKKRGVIEMSPVNIESLLLIVQENADHYEHADFYESTLAKWQEGNFSNAVTVHNTIWDWHNGTIGRATGLMSAEQEQEFVEQHFR
ncbi:DUF6241 domain-containing protein [Planococcus versutus]|uniref:Uncharacterized protein n=1 Tax=Planococcus versutus TaxID=1302659 RepID=A0A1B1S328_9BACL|nr:DUF6241 domain-containing protein [Planococcus versutus]ANU27590.1 hypothetical protein I858_011400 [Planococcus versutus]